MAKEKRIQTGMKGIPLNKGFNKCDYYFSYDLEKKDFVNIVKKWVRETYSKPDASAILANPEWNFHMHSGIAAAIYWMSNGLEFSKEYEKYPMHIENYFTDLLEKGKLLLKDKIPEGPPKRVLSPKERLIIKINRTVMLDIDNLEDEWYRGEKTSLDIVAKFRINELKGMAVDPVKLYLKSMLPDYEDAHAGSCKDAKDGYKHLTKRELTRRIKEINNMISSLEIFKEESKAKRKRKIK